MCVDCWLEISTLSPLIQHWSNWLYLNCENVRTHSHWIYSWKQCVEMCRETKDLLQLYREIVLRYFDKLWRVVGDTIQINVLYALLSSLFTLYCLLMWCELTCFLSVFVLLLILLLWMLLLSYNVEEYRRHLCDVGQWMCESELKQCWSTFSHFFTLFSSSHLILYCCYSLLGVCCVVEWINRKVEFAFVFGWNAHTTEKLNSVCCVFGLGSDVSMCKIFY
jgi:hypothetical protein